MKMMKKDLADAMNMANSFGRIDKDLAGDASMMNKDLVDGVNFDEQGFDASIPDKDFDGW